MIPISVFIISILKGSKHLKCKANDRFTESTKNLRLFHPFYTNQYSKDSTLSEPECRRQLLQQLQKQQTENTVVIATHMRSYRGQIGHW